MSFQIDLVRPDTGGTVRFYTTVSPRNNSNSGGAALPSAANPPPEYSGKQCFVTTAAYGDADHPVVEVLRQFRDRVLLPTDPGKALVRYYYEVGPSLAAAIEDKPLACLLIRLLVTPLAGFALLTMSCPVLIPVILLLSWGLARLALKALRRRSSRWTNRLQGQRGAMLVTLIAAMVVFAALGAVMIGMFGTSALSQVAGNSAMKAYYLAESGFRYAASEYIAGTSETLRETAIESMHNQTYQLADGGGRFQLLIHPYYYRSKALPSGLYLDARIIGGFPFKLANGLPDASYFNNGSWVRIERADNSIDYAKLWGVSYLASEGGKLQLTRMVGSSAANWDSAPAIPVPIGSRIVPACVPDSSKLSLTDDGDLFFVSDSGARAFPDRNGTMMVMLSGESTPRILSYRELDLTNKKFKGVRDPNGITITGKQVVNPGTVEPYANYVTMTNFVRVESTGTFGTGASAVNRKVTYFTPIGSAKGEQAPKSKFHDDMQDLTKWQRGDHIGRIGTSTPGTSYGTTLKVETTQVLNQAPGVDCLKFREFQVGYNWSGAGIPLQQEWLRAGNYLSYDLQMKAFYTLIDPSPKHALGLTFRLDEEGNALGFTYARGVPGYTGGCDNDGIPHGWLYGYPEYTPLLLFWMKEYTKKESGIEAVPSPCSTTPPTTISELPRCDRVTKAIFSNRNDWQNGERVRFTNTGGALPPPIVAGRDYYIRAILYNSNTYLYLFSNETGALNFDPDWPGLVNITDYGLGTTTIIVQDPTFTKLAHQALTSGNEYYNLMTSYYLKGFATFMTRVMEAPSVSFVNGGGTAGREILSGETVYQTSNNLAGGTLNAIYKAMRSPFYRAAKSGGQRLWSSGTEQGVLLLERISGNTLSDPSTAPFTAGSKIFVGEHPGGTNAGTVGVPGGVSDVVFRKRDNWLMFYVGDPSGNTPADIDPFNNYRGSILRNSVLWPPDNPEATAINTDNFTLLRFSDYVNAVLPAWSMAWLGREFTA